MTTSLVAAETELRQVTRRLAESPVVALDIESNGLFKYKATLCTMQLATPDEIVVVDTIAAPLEALVELLGSNGPRKIVHDVAFDARILAEAGIALGNVLDTSLTARMLGRTATGLASLLMSELGVTVDKKLQHHDWTERPILPHQLQYLADDVVHLHALAAKLWAEAEERGITDAIEEETRYRLAQAQASVQVVDPRPPYVRLKGIDRVPEVELPILRRLAEIREEKAKRADVPPYKVIGPDILFAIAHARPETMDDLAKLKGAVGGHRARSIAPALLDAVRAGLLDDGIPDAERAMITKPRLPPAVAKARRARESRLGAWRKVEAKARGIDEQVVLPGHCLQDLADLEEPTLDAVLAVPGLGRFRIERDGEAILGALLATSVTGGPTPPASEPEVR